MRKPPRILTADEETALAADLLLRKTLTNKALMLKYNASRSLIDTVGRKSKALVSSETKQDAFPVHRRTPMTPTEIDALARALAV